MKVFVGEPQVSHTTFSLNIEQDVPVSTEQLRNFRIDIGVVVSLHNYHTETNSTVIDAEQRRELCSLKIKNGKVKEDFSGSYCLI